MAVTIKTPSLRKEATAMNYISSLDLAPIANGIHKPDVSDQIVQRYGRQLMSGFFDYMGNKETVYAQQTEHYEEEFIHGTFRISAGTASASGGTTLNGTVAAAYNYTYSGNNAPYISQDEFTSSMPSVYDVIQVKGWEAVVTNVSGSAFTAETVDGTVKPAIATTDDFMIKGNTVPEGSSPVASRNSTLKKFTSYTQISRRDHIVTNTEAGNKVWVEVQTDKGTGHFWYLKGLQDEFDRLENEREIMLLTGKNITNTALTNGSLPYGDLNTITKTQGLIPQISGNGNVEGYTSGSFAYSDLTSMASKLIKYRGAKENMLFCGFDFGLEFDAIARAESGLTNGGLVYNTFNGEGKQGANFQFDYYSLAGYTFNKSVLDIFSDPTMLGIEGEIYSSLGILIPMDNTAIYNSMNAASSRRVPSLTLLEREDEEGSRWYKEWVTGKGMGASTSGDDFFQVHMLTDFGLRAAALNRFGLFVSE